MSKTKPSEIASAMGVDAYKPTLTLDKKIYPDLDKLKVDDEIELTLKVKITDVSRPQYGDGSKHVSGTIENAQDESEDD